MNYNLGQDMKPEAATQQFAVTGYKRKIDIATGPAAHRADADAEVRVLPGSAAAKADPGVDGDVAFNVNAEGKRAPAALAETDRRIDLYHRR